MSNSQTPKPQDSSVSERLAASQALRNKGVTCPSCGGEWFSPLTFSRYSGRGYASSPGADMHEISAMPQTVRVCLCGQIYQPNLSGIRGRIASGEIESFTSSINAANDFRGKPGKDLIALTDQAVTRKEHKELSAQVDKLSKKPVPKTPKATKADKVEQVKPGDE